MVSLGAGEERKLVDRLFLEYTAASLDRKGGGFSDHAGLDDYQHPGEYLPQFFGYLILAEVADLHGAQRTHSKGMNPHLLEQEL